MLRTTTGITIALCAIAALDARPVSAQALTTQRIATGLASPLYLTSPAGDFARLFVVEQAGRIRILKNGGLLPTPFLDIDPLVVGPNFFGDERGLLGLAFHPDYANNGFFYVSYTAVAGGGDSIVARYSVDPGNPDVANPNSAVLVYGPINQPQSNHNGGCIQFGPDGKLYLGLGDGGNANDQGTGHVAGGNAQSPTTPLGKMLRFDVDIPFPHIPSDNPFVGQAPLDEIWDLGVRNPWRFSFDSLTGDLYIGDVGQGAREEVDIEPPGTGGLNYGWRCMEGFNCTGLSGCTCNAPNLTLPVHDYDHGGGRCSITGGYVYRGCAIPGLEGTYFFADFCSAQIWSFEWNGASIQNFVERTAELTPNVGSISAITSFGQDAFGELYILDGSGGEVFKILPAAGIIDCNNNSTSDACEIAVGAVSDLDGNQVPDVCECPAATTYCQAKFSSQFCFPQVDSVGFATASGGTPFDITCSVVDNFKNGLLFYGIGQSNTAFMGGTLCVLPPLRRTTIQNAGGTLPPAQDCSGTFSYDMAARIASGVDPALVGGATANAQYWFRDPGDAFGIGLSNALEFGICNL